VSISTLRRWKAAGKLVAEHTAGGHRRYDRQAAPGTVSRLPIPQEPKASGWRQTRCGTTPNADSGTIMARWRIAVGDNGSGNRIGASVSTAAQPRAMSTAPASTSRSRGSISTTTAARPTCTRTGSGRPPPTPPAARSRAQYSGLPTDTSSSDAYMFHGAAGDRTRRSTRTPSAPQDVGIAAPAPSTFAASASASARSPQ